MKETQTQIDSKIENLIELYPDIYINYVDFHKQINDTSNENFEKYWEAPTHTRASHVNYPLVQLPPRATTSSGHSLPLRKGGRPYHEGEFTDLRI